MFRKQSLVYLLFFLFACEAAEETSSSDGSIQLDHQIVDQHIDSRIADASVPFADNGVDAQVPERGVCGDGIVDDGEGCDDGNTVTEECAYGEAACTVCAADCTEQSGETDVCGDGTVDDGEGCDDGNTVTEECAYGEAACTVCAADCTEQPGETDVCGDGTVDDGEGCDDGNTVTEECLSGQQACVVCAADCTEQPGVIHACDDQQRNGEETGTDCGGPDCQSCFDGEACIQDRDCAGLHCEAGLCVDQLVRVAPAPYARALRNPMKGLTTNGVNPHEWANLNHVYIRWNELEDREADGIDRIRWVTEQKFAGVAERNVKVIPRVYLHWSRNDQKYWPSDMVTDDYTSEQFQRRLRRLIGRLGEVWNDDPRVAFIELGIFGKWGEHHSPAPEPFMQALAGEAFAAAFPNKHISVRHAWREFEGHDFGEYWDSFSHYDQMWPHGQQVHTMNERDDRWKRNYIGGETAYDWGNWEQQPGTNPTDSVRDPIHRAFIINSIRWLHCTQLRWIHAYDANDPLAQAGAEEVHKAMGYRYVMEGVEFSPRVTNGSLRVALTIRNEGVAPFYYRWPVTVYLLDEQSRQPVWQAQYQGADIRTWLGGEEWTTPDWIPVNHWSQNIVENRWADTVLEWGLPAPLHRIDERFDVNLPEGRYLLAVGIPDPANGRPNLRFANGWYLNGGFHPIGLVGVGQQAGGPLPADMVFDDPFFDQSLSYGRD
ncbi:MAG: DUF4832 domain-containing protein [Myxococcota bacterium]|nr:DUF4832 domain-containing protein [Myxococcota bacterium]